MIIINTGGVNASTVWSVSGGVIEAPVRRTGAKIKSFGRIQEGWHYGSGRAASSDIVNLALEYLDYFFMLGFVETDAFPGSDGQIMVTAYRGKHSVEVTVESDKSFSVARQIDGKDALYEPCLSRIDASLELSKAIAAIEQEECATSVWSTSSTTITGLGNLETLRLPHLAMEPERQLLTNNAESLRVEQYVPTSNNFMKVSVGNPRFFGRSAKPNWTKSAA